MLVPTPHDSLFKYAFGDPKEAAALLQAILPASMSRQLDLSSISPLRGSFTDKELASRHSDILFSAPLASGQGCALVYLLMEHQSTPEPAMASRLLGYLTRVWEQYEKEHSTYSMPPIVPVVLYHGDRSWNAARRMHDQLTVPATELGEMSSYVPSFSYVLHDLSRISDYELRGRALGKMVLWMFKYSPNKQLWETMPEWIGLLAAVLKESGLGAVEAVLRYILSVEEEMPKEKARRLLAEHLGPQGTEAIMTAGEKLVEQGRLEGRVEGRVEGRAETARSLVQRLLQRRFRTLPPSVVKRIEAADVDQLELCAERILDAESIEDVLSVLD